MNRTPSTINTIFIFVFKYLAIFIYNEHLLFEVLNIAFLCWFIGIKRCLLSKWGYKSGRRFAVPWFVGGFGNACAGCGEKDSGG